MPHCKFCEQEVEKLIDCHIIPRAFFEHMKKWGNIDSMPVYNNFSNMWPKGKSRIGWYDSEIVCENCEKIFGPFDDYAIKILLRTQLKQYSDANGPLGWMIDAYDYKKLKLFFISTMWRIGASERPEFKKIDLGPDLKILKDHIVNSNAGDINTFSVILARFSDVSGQHFQLNPHKEVGNAFGAVRFYRLYTGAGYIAYIKIDKRSLVEAGSEWLPVAIQKDRPLFIINRSEATKSKEFEIMSKMLKNSIQVEKERK